MSFPESLNPSMPPPNLTVAGIPGAIRDINQYLADVFGLPSTVNAPALSVTAAGVVTLAQSGALVIADPTTPLGIASKQYVDARTGGAGGYASANLGAPLNFNPGILTSILTLNVTAPASGGPYRLLVSYALAVSSTSSSIADFQVSDGTHTFAFSTEVLTTQNAGVSVSDFSPVTYAAGTALTLTLSGQSVGATTAVSVNSPTGLYTSILKAIFIPSS